MEAKIESTLNERELADKKYMQQYRELTKQRMPEKSKENQLAPLIHLKKTLDNWLRILRAWVDEKTEPYEKVPLTSKYRQHKMQKISNQIVLDAGRSLIDKDSNLLLSVGETILTPTNQQKLSLRDSANSTVKMQTGKAKKFDLA